MSESPMFIIPQKAIIKKESRFLILKRAPDSAAYPDHWDFPGGKLEYNEAPREGLEREVLEETGLKVKVGKPVFTFSETAYDKNVFFADYECELVSGEVRLSEEHTDFKWATKEEILELKIENNLKAFLEQSK